MENMRVFPFSFPPIMGGAQGGVSPTPTPEPDDPYDLDSVAISLVFGNMGAGVGNWSWESTKSEAYMKLDVSGTSAVNIADVTQVVLDFSDITFQANGSDVAMRPSSPTTVSISGADLADLNGEHFPGYISTGGNYNGEPATGSGNVVINVYDADGNVIQTATVAVS